MFITLEPHGLFDKILHTYTCQHDLTTGMCSNPLDGQGFAEHQSSRARSVSKIAQKLLNHMVYLNQILHTDLF